MNEHVYRVDHEFIRKIAAIVVDRLRQMQNETLPVSHNRDEKVISERMLLELPNGSTLNVRHDALVTPLAKDTSRDRDIQIIRSSKRN